MPHNSNEDNYNCMGERLQELREDHHWKQGEVAEMLGVSRSAISTYESGRISPPRDILIQLADLYNVSTDYLFGRTRNKTSMKDIMAVFKTESADVKFEDLVAKINKLSVRDRTLLFKIINQFEEYNG